MYETISAFPKTSLPSTSELESGAAKEERAHSHCGELGRGATEQEGKGELRGWGGGAEHQRREGRPPSESLPARWGLQDKRNWHPSSKEMQKDKNVVLLSDPRQPMCPVSVPADSERIHSLVIPPSLLGLEQPSRLSIPCQG